MATIDFGNTVNELFFTAADDYLLAVGHGAVKVDFNANGSFLSSAHQNGLIKLWVWMGEDSPSTPGGTRT